MTTRQKWYVGGGIGGAVLAIFLGVCLIMWLRSGSVAAQTVVGSTPTLQEQNDLLKRQIEELQKKNGVPVPTSTGDRYIVVPFVPVDSSTKTTTNTNTITNVMLGGGGGMSFGLDVSKDGGTKIGAQMVPKDDNEVKELREKISQLEKEEAGLNERIHQLDLRSQERKLRGDNDTARAIKTNMKVLGVQLKEILSKMDKIREELAKKEEPKVRYLPAPRAEALPAPAPVAKKSVKSPAVKPVAKATTAKPCCGK